MIGRDYPRPNLVGLNLVGAVPKTDHRRALKTRLACPSLPELNSMSIDTPTQDDGSVAVSEGERAEPSMAPSVTPLAVASQHNAREGPRGEVKGGPGLVAQMRRRLKPIVRWVLRVDAKAVALVARIPVKPKVLAWGMLGVGLSIWAAGLVLYFTSPPPQEESPVGPPVQEAGPTPSPQPEAPVPVAEQKETAQPPSEPAPPPVVLAPKAPEPPRESALASDSEGPVLGKIHLEKPEIAPVRPRVIDPALENDSAPEHSSEKTAAKDGTSAQEHVSAHDSTKATRAAAETQAAAEGVAPPGGAAKPDNAIESVFGADQSGNGVPDGLDRWMAKTFQSKVAQEAAQAYYRSALPLANKAYLGVSLSKSEKIAVMKAAECYLITAHEEGMRGAPNLNDRVLMMGGEAAERIKGLFKQVEGFDYPVKGVRKLACS